MSSIIASVAFKSIFSEAVEYLKRKIPSLKITKANINEAYLKSSNVENVKTIWQVDKNINLNEFYYPSKIFVSGSKVLVDSLSSFPPNGKVVIQGIAGQGKSILLRYLVGKELKYGNKIPLFIELRKISDKKTLEKLILESVSELGIDVGDSQLNYIFKSNKFSLILDAFDEIPEKEVKAAVTYLEFLCSKYFSQQIIVSSRPNSDIQMITYFDVYNLAPLGPRDFTPILTKFFDNQENIIDDIILSINNNTSNMEQLLTTPLLLTLLTITYKSYNRIPLQLHEFYENLFHLLVSRHDSTKPGFRRKYKSELNERELEDLFCAFSFYCMKMGKVSLTSREANNAVSDAIHITNIKGVYESDFLNDCIRNTSLILKEGLEYHFIHKSIREYHAASYIKFSPTELKEKFYSNALRHSSKYYNELQFLSVIDEHSYNQLFLLPLYRMIFSKFSFDSKSNKIDKASFDNIQLEADKDYGNLVSVNFGDLHEIDISYFGVNTAIFEVIVNNYVEIDFKQKAENYKLKDVDLSNRIRNKIEKVIITWCVENFDKYILICESVRNRENIIEQIDF